MITGEKYQSCKKEDSGKIRRPAEAMCYEKAKQTGGYDKSMELVDMDEISPDITDNDDKMVAY